MSSSVDQPNAPVTALQQFDSNAASYEEYIGGCTAEVMENALPYLPEITSDSVILDNACGTGLVTEILLGTLHGTGLQPKIRGVDGAPRMIEIARNRFAAHSNVHVEVAPGEDLSLFGDATFTHSLTNMGLFFFTDAPKGAREIFRTLTPGGTAIATGWTDLGYLKPIHAVQNIIRPGSKLFALPFPEQWLNPQHMKQTLSDAGFHVELHQATVHRAANSVGDLAHNMMKWLSMGFLKDWSAEEVKRGEELFVSELGSVVEEFTRSGGEKLVGIKMEAYIAVCKK